MVMGLMGWWVGVRLTTSESNRYSYVTVAKGWGDVWTILAGPSTDIPIYNRTGYYKGNIFTLQMAKK